MLGNNQCDWRESHETRNYAVRVNSKFFTAKVNMKCTTHCVVNG